VRGLEGATETLAIGFVFGVFFGGWGCSQLSSDGDAPMDKANHQCEEAWVAANDGDPETEPGAITEEPWCQEHNAAMQVEQKQDDMETIRVEAAP
jgi:hypothetical protein